MNGIDLIELNEKIHIIESVFLKYNLGYFLNIVFV